MAKTKFYTIQEVADILGVGKSTLYNWERLRKIPKARREGISNYRIFTPVDITRLQKITGRVIQNANNDKKSKK